MAEKKTRRKKKTAGPTMYVHPEGDLIQHKGAVWAPGTVIDLSKLPDTTVTKLKLAHAVLTETQFQRDFVALWNKAHPMNKSPFPDIDAAMDAVDNKKTIIKEGLLPHQME